MTSLLSRLREAFGHRHDPPPMLPDKVTWTVPDEKILKDEGLQDIANRFNRTEDHRDSGGDKWRVMGISDDGQPVLQRQDGAYRWRDDGFAGF